jgi:hypothetical protein
VTNCEINTIKRFKQNTIKFRTEDAPKIKADLQGEAAPKSEI